MSHVGVAVLLAIACALVGTRTADRPAASRTVLAVGIAVVAVAAEALVGLTK